MKIAGVDEKHGLQKSFQGEGPYAGKRIVILRFMGCNLKCHWQTGDGRFAWCDEKRTWDGSEHGNEWDVDDLVKKIVKVSKEPLPVAKWEPKGASPKDKAEIVMVTGGEPMLRQGSEAFQDLMEKLHAEGLKLHFETNGTIAPNEWARENIDFFDVSEKFQLYPEKYTAKLLKEWQDCGAQVAHKFVIGRMEDLFLLREWLVQMQLRNSADIWLMPLTADDKSMGQALDVLRSGAIEAIRIAGFLNVHLSPRLHVDGRFP